MGQTYVSTETIQDNCGNKIVLSVTRTFTLNQQECREFKCEIDIVVLQGAQYLLNYQNMNWNTGFYHTKIYNLTDVASFYFDYGQSIQNISFEFEAKTVCGTFGFIYSDDVVVANGDCYASCSSSFSYCEFYSPGAFGTGKEMPELKGFYYLDGNNVPHYINSSNNPGGIFDFPYYCHVADQCSFPPNIYDFERDLNDFLDLGNTMPAYGTLYGTAMWMHSYGQGSPPDLCKLNLRIKNSKIFIYQLDFEIWDFDKPNCSILPYISDPNHHVYFYPNFPPAYDCLGGNYANEGNDNLNDIYHSHLQSEALTAIDVNRTYRIYPTVTDGRITIDFDAVQSVGKHIELYTVSGTMVKRFDIRANVYEVSLDFTEIGRGIYLMKIFDTDNKNYTVEKIVKQ